MIKVMGSGKDTEQIVRKSRLESSLFQKLLRLSLGYINLSQLYITFHKIWEALPNSRILMMLKMKNKCEYVLQILKRYALKY